MTTESEDIVFVATGTKDEKKVAHALMGAGAAGKGFFFAGLQQAIENAEDAGATEIYISIDRREKTIRLSDNGGGFLKKNADGFFSLMVSPKTGKPGQIGRNGSGRYFLLHFCEALKVFTKSDDFKKIVTFALQRGDVEELIRTEKISRPVKVCEKPDFWDLPGNGSVIVLDGIRDEVWGRIPSNKIIVSDFGRQLKPSIARKIFVNGVPLKPRTVMGDIIDRKFESVDGLPGVNSIYLFIPEQRMPGEELGLGAMNNVATLKEVVRQLPLELKGLVPAELAQGRLLGDIYIPELNKFRAHDGRSFNDELFASPEIQSLVLFLDREVRPLIEEHFAERKSEEDKEARAEAMDSICKKFRECWDLDPDEIDDGPEEEEKKDDGEDPVQEQISVIPRTLVCLPGTDVTFRAVGKTKLLGKLRWEAESSGGKVVPKVGLEAVYSAGNDPGKYTLTVRHPSKPAIFRKINIRIEPNIALKISPIRTEIIQGESHVFRARNVEMTTSAESDKIVWELTSVSGDRAKGIRTSTKRGAKIEVKVSKDAPCGDYELTCWDADDPTNHRSKATFEVVEQPDEVGNFIKIENVVYEVVEASVRLHNLVELGEPRISLTDPTKSYPTLQIDMEHDLIKGHELGSETYRQVLFPDLIGAHLQRKVDEGDEPSLSDPAAFRMRLTELRTKLQQASSKKVETPTAPTVAIEE